MNTVSSPYMQVLHLQIWPTERGNFSQQLVASVIVKPSNMESQLFIYWKKSAYKWTPQFKHLLSEVNCITDFCVLILYPATLLNSYVTANTG